MYYSDIKYKYRLMDKGLSISSLGAHIHGGKEGTFMANVDAIYGEVYNYYQGIYAPKANSRYDAHKKSDLKKVYNSIINDNKEKPVYLLDPFSRVRDYTIALKEGAMQFGRDIAAMGGNDGESLFDQKNVYSSDPDIAFAESMPGKRASDEGETVTVTVDRIAQNQENRGRFLNEDELGLENGTYSFDVATSSSNYELQFGISDNDNNYTIQKRLARLINNAAIGMNAKVIDGDDGTHALSISSQSPGSADGEAPFIISDENTSQKKGVIDYLGIRNATKEASWAAYTINGERMTSPDNSVVIGGEYAVTFRSAGGPERPVTIGTKANMDSLRENVIGVAGAYNKFIQTASEFLQSQPKSNVLIDSMKRMGSYYASTLEKFGITSSDSGELKVDEDKLDELLTNTTTDSDVSELKNFTKSAYRKISHVQLDPMDYVDKRIVSYKNPTKTHFANPYITSSYSGMIFNSYM